MALNITRGVQERAQKVVLYGVEGIGKTMLASQFPNPLFIDTEDSTAHLDVARTDPPKSWSELLSQVDTIQREHPCDTLVIDTADWAERLCIEHIVTSAGNAKIKSIEDFGYGHGYTKLVEEFGRLLDRLSALARDRINVVLTAHADIRKFEQPDEAASYDRWELKLSKSGQKKLSPLVKEWADAVLFLNYKTIVETVSAGMGASKGKARGGQKRVMYTEHHACWDAKNRWGLASELPMEYEQIADHIPSFSSCQAPQETPRTGLVSNSAYVEAVKADAKLQKIKAQLSPTKDDTAPGKLHELNGLPDWWEPVLSLMDAAGVSVDEIRSYAARKGHFSADTPASKYPQDYVAGALVSSWDTVLANILQARGVRDSADITVPFD